MEIFTQRSFSSAKDSSAVIMAWVCKTVSGTGTLAFINNFTADRSKRMNEERYRQ